MTVLATSREALAVDGEQQSAGPAAPRDDAVALFVQRARAVSPDFRLDRANADAVAAICARVDGLPLGIELAAARMRAMSPVEVARRLEGAPLLGGGRGPVARHQSLAAAIDWSYRLLPEPEQRLFAALSVFAGGADLRGVHRVTDPGASEDDVLDRLVRLVDRSLVVAVSAVHSRYRLLETLRAYGRNRVEPRAPTVRWPTGTPRYYVELAERAAHGLQGPDERAWVDDALADYDNMRAAFVSACADRDADLAVRLVASIPELVHLRIGYEASGWAERALVEADPSTRAMSPRSVPPHGGHGTVATSRSPGSWLVGPRAAYRPREPPVSPIPVTSWPTWRCTRATSIVRCGTTPPRRSVPVPRATGSGSSGRSTTWRSARPSGAPPSAASGRRWRASRSRTRQPTRRLSRWRATRWAWC